MRKKRNKTKIVIIIISSILLLAGVYFLLLYFSPKLKGFYQKNSTVTIDENRNNIKIASHDINALITEGGEEELDKGAWHRFPERGNPEKGGNFILSGHRFKIAATPAQVKDASVLYDIDKLNVGGKIIVHWNGRKYNYTVTKRYKVKPDQIEIEQSNETRMTLYTCTMAGAYDGREVVEAKLEL